MSEQPEGAEAVGIRRKREKKGDIIAVCTRCAASFSHAFFHSFPFAGQGRWGLFAGLFYCLLVPCP